MHIVCIRASAAGSPLHAIQQHQIPVICDHPQRVFPARSAHEASSGCSVSSIASGVLSLRDIGLPGMAGRTMSHFSASDSVAVIR